MPETGWLGRDWYEADIVEENRGPPLQYLVTWTGYGDQKDWVDSTDVTPLAVAAFLEANGSADEVATYWEGVLIEAVKSGDIDKVRSVPVPELERFANCRDEVRVCFVCVCRFVV